MSGSTYGRVTVAWGCMALATACTGGGGTDGRTRCDDDRFDCQDIAEVPTVEGCALGGELVVTIGYGLDAFSSASLGQAPPTIVGGGGFQGAGSSHTVFGLRIVGAALDRYDVLGAQIGVYESHVCAMEADTRTCEGVPWVAQRTVLLGDGPPLNTVGDVVEEFGITAPMESEAGSFVVQAVVTDPCGLVGVAHHDFSQ